LRKEERFMENFWSLNPKSFLTSGLEDPAGIRQVISSIVEFGKTQLELDKFPSIFVRKLMPSP
jgi:hypothetical protein